uniref:SR-related and CTD-associated factor 4-like isoform X2 n=1 Tax=Doryrhamphus excisus TaxID=161450 RepID=UPI0025AE77D8|nr:SR-related and CTD-associated factor 4-like isoform X2 [Doryrhamphus excisus]
MEAVNAFNVELFSMIDMKPPISRAKMMSVTKSAIKAIKLYKHVVQIVEKFIKRCKPELKVPGLYVVDSIVRQSRHQFGVDKDVFGPRFLKNFTDTFQNLYQCPEDDKTKIVRVLNLWQKNGVFDMDILQPLMDMANGVIEPAPSLEVPAEPPQPPPMVAPVVPTLSQMPTSDALAAVAQLFQSSHGQELQKMLQNLQQAEKTCMLNNTNGPHPSQMAGVQPQMLIAHAEEDRSSLAEKLLGRFDYDDEPEDAATKDTIDRGFPGQMPIMETVDPHQMGQPAPNEFGGGGNHIEYQMMMDGQHSRNNTQNSRSQVDSREEPSTRREGRGRRTRSPRRRRSRSSSRSRRSRHRRSRSRSRDRRWRSRSRDRPDRERDRERRQKGLPSIKSQTLSVCSTTLWVGQLDKKTQQSDVTSLLEEFGQIDSINMIPPRGCAYIVMVHRQDAYTALNKLSRGSYKVNQKPVKIAWALNKGIKPAHKKFWDVERGVTYIPWGKVKAEELQGYREGGMLDPDTLSEEWKSAAGLNMQTAVNGVSDRAPADGMMEAQIQVPAVQPPVPITSPLLFPPPVMLSPVSMSPLGGPVPVLPDLKPPSTAAGANPPADATPDADKTSDPKLGSPKHTVMNLPAPQPGMPPLHPPPPHMAPFLPPPNMAPQMMPGGLVLSPSRFRMHLPFPPRGPMLPRSPFAAPPEVGMGARVGPPFRGRPPFGGPPRIPRGGW